LETREFAGAGRFEWGLTDRWEADFEFGFAGAEQTFNGTSLFDPAGRQTCWWEFVTACWTNRSRPLP
jgi:hypothetical protein